jgi:hypothetical protein
MSNLYGREWIILSNEAFVLVIGTFGRNTGCAADRGAGTKSDGVPTETDNRASTLPCRTPNRLPVLRATATATRRHSGAVAMSGLRVRIFRVSL